MYGRTGPIGTSINARRLQPKAVCLMGIGAHVPCAGALPGGSHRTTESPSPTSFSFENYGIP